MIKTSHSMLNTNNQSIVRGLWCLTPLSVSVIEHESSTTNLIITAQNVQPTSNAIL